MKRQCNKPKITLNTAKNSPFIPVRNFILFFIFMIIFMPMTVYAQGMKTGPSGLPIPRFVSLKSNPVNVRVGPSIQHNIDWTFKKAGLPVEVIAEFDNWRRIRDWEGEEGWVAHQLLSGRRTILITPWQKEGLIPVHSNAGETSAVVAKLEPGVLAGVKQCNGQWCEITGNSWKGWVKQDKLWGIYPDENLD